MEKQSEYLKLVNQLTSLRSVKFDYNVDINRYIPTVGKLIDCTTLEQAIQSTQALIQMRPSDDVASLLGISIKDTKKTADYCDDLITSKTSSDTTINIDAYIEAYKLRVKEIKVKSNIALIKKDIETLRVTASKDELQTENLMVVSGMFTDLYDLGDCYVEQA